MGRLLLLYVDDAIEDTTLFGTVRGLAFDIMPKDFLLTEGQRLCEKSPSQMALRWQAVDKVTARCKKNLRPLAMATDFSSASAHDPWLMALAWMKSVFSRQQTLAQRPLDEIPDGTIPKRLRSHLLVLDEEGKATGIRGDRYEFWIYRQTRKRLDINELYLNDSVVNRRFSDELVSMDQKADILKKLDIPWTFPGLASPSKIRLMCCILNLISNGNNLTASCAKANSSTLSMIRLLNSS